MTLLTKLIARVSAFATVEIILHETAQSIWFPEPELWNFSYKLKESKMRHCDLSDESGKLNHLTSYTPSP